MEKGLKMDLKELLKSQELSDEQIEAITGAMTENKLFVTSEENADIRLNKLKQERDEAVTARDELQATITQHEAEKSDLEAKLNELNEKGGSDADKQAEIDELKAQLEEATGNYSKLNKQVKLENALRDAGAKDIAYASYKFGGADKVELDEDGNIVGLEENITALKEQIPKFFADTQDTSVVGAGLKGDNKQPELDPFTAVREKYTK